MLLWRESRLGRRKEIMDAEVLRLEPSPPMYYRLELPLKVRPLDEYIPIRTMLALDVVHYMAVHDISPLSEVIDTIKVFTIMLYLSEEYSKISKTGLMVRRDHSNEKFLDKAFSNEEDLDKAFSACRKKGQDLRTELHENFTDHSITDMASQYWKLWAYYSDYDELPQSVIADPDEAKVHPSLQSVIDFLEKESGTTEVDSVLPILYILAGQIGRPLELYGNKLETADMSLYDYYNLGTIYLIEKHDYPEAREYLGILRGPLANHNMGMTYLREAKWQEAGEYFSFVVRHTKDMINENESRPTYFLEDVAIQRSANNLGYCVYRLRDDARGAIDMFDAAANHRVLTGYDDGLSNRRFLVEEQLKHTQPANERQEKEGQEKKEFHGIFGKCDAMQKVYELIKKAACNDLSVLITGETGTGKELVARAIHSERDRMEKPFIDLNCATIMKGLAESELFGHEEKSFNEAIERIGKFELADGGTLFLDEIGELSPELQVKLLRAIEYKEFTRVGGNKTIKVNTRIISATNRDLEEEVEAGMFREDLYARIEAFPIHLPPLRERKEDIPLLIERFLGIDSTPNRRMQISENVQIILENYRWPRNVRQLKNVLARAVFMTDGEVIRMPDIPEYIYNEVRKKKEVEKQIIINSLQENDWEIAGSARDLGISRQAVYRRMEKYNIVRKASKSGK